MAKIGLSYSRCVRDIVDGKVDINDVLVIIARTNFDPLDDKQWKNIWEGYGGGGNGAPFRGFFNATLPEWDGYSDEDEYKFRNVSAELWKQGKLHQPRKFGAMPSRFNYYWLETVLPSDELDDYPTVKDAWEKFQVLAGLTSVKMDKGAG